MDNILNFSKKLLHILYFNFGSSARLGFLSFRSRDLFCFNLFQGSRLFERIAILGAGAADIVT